MDSGLGGVRDPRREAQGVVGHAFDARVLEPSPPAVLDGEWFADDPVAVEPRAERDRPVVGPVGDVDLTWAGWLRDHPGQLEWAAARWLAGHRPLPKPPPSLAGTRGALHRLAVYVVSPARRRANGKIALRWTCGGFGTPFFGADEQLRVTADGLVRQRGDAADTQSFATLGAAAGFALDGPPDVAWARPFDVPAAGDPDAPLGVDHAAAAFLGDWYGFAYSVLEELRADPASVQPSRVQVWPEHFDAAFDSRLGAGRATFGASPGDAAVEEPYLYVLPPDPDAVRPGDEWNATAFRGAILRLGEFVDADDQRAAALAFLRRRRGLLGR